MEDTAVRSRKERRAEDEKHAMGKDPGGHVTEIEIQSQCVDRDVGLAILYSDNRIFCLYGASAFRRVDCHGSAKGPVTKYDV